MADAPLAFPERAARFGPQRFAAFMEWALYDERSGFYAAGGGAAGRRGGSFITSPEVGPLFGAVVARALDSWWETLGRPDPYVVVDAGAGPGTLARCVLASEPACASALRYVLVERSAVQRARHAEHLALDPAAFAFSPEDDDAAGTQPIQRGPIAVSLAELPRLAAPCVVLANELLDNLPFDLWEHRNGRWCEVLVDEGLGELVVAAEPPPWLEEIAATDGSRVPVQTAARRWLEDARALARPDEGGRVVIIDYCATTAELAARPVDDWLRTYRAHERGDPPLDVPGTQDITAEVCLDQLPAPSKTWTQADWLRSNGIEELVVEGRREWDARAHIGDLAAVRMRSRVTEAEALLDPAGLGGFTVAEWTG